MADNRAVMEQNRAMTKHEQIHSNLSSMKHVSFNKDRHNRLFKHMCSIVHPTVRVKSSFLVQLTVLKKTLTLIWLRPLSQHRKPNRKPKAEPNGYRMRPKALDLLHFEPEFHRMQ